MKLLDVNLVVKDRSTEEGLPSDKFKVFARKRDAKIYDVRIDRPGTYFHVEFQQDFSLSANEIEWPWVYFQLEVGEKFDEQKMIMLAMAAMKLRGVTTLD